VEKLEYIVTEFHSPDAKCRGTLADLLLDAHLISRCGLIPPFRVISAALRTGGGDGGMSPGCIWEPFEITEDEYWEAVARLERFTPDDLSSRHRNPQIFGEIRTDYSAPETDDYGVWADSLVQRGYLPKGPFGDLRR
jgi:hypothetical protein